MTKEFFESVMRVPTCSSSEDMMQKFLLDFAKSNGFSARKDGKGNIFMKKGSAKFYPTFVNHIDSVHHDQKDLVEKEIFKEIVWKGDKVTAVNPETGKQTGLGMDDQGGCAIALAVMTRLPAAKAIFFVEEEVGMQGSKAADLSFLDDAAFVFSNDSPDRNRATHYSSGVELYSTDFFDKYIQPISSKHGVSSFRSEPFTDIIQCRRHEIDGKHLECFNFGNGGYDPHQDSEYASFSDVNAAEEMLYALATEIPTDVQHLSEITPEPRRTFSWGGVRAGRGSVYSDYDWDNAEDADYEFADTDVISYKDRDDNDMCTIMLAFDDQEQFSKFNELVDGEGVAVNVDLKDEDTAEVFGELCEIKKAYILWYQLFYDSPDIKTWDQLVDDKGDIDFDNDVIFEEPYVPSDGPDIPEQQGGFKSRDEVDEFWAWMNAHK